MEATAKPFPYILRAAGLEDLELICRHREAMFRASGRPETDLQAMRSPFRHWLARELDQGRYFGFIAESLGAQVGGVGTMVLEWPPHPSHPEQAQRGYILNLFVEPEHRGHGLGAVLMSAAEADLVERGVGYAFLHATEQARPLYAATGWLTTSEMAKPRLGAARSIA